MRGRHFANKARKEREELDKLEKTRNQTNESVPVVLDDNNPTLTAIPQKIIQDEPVQNELTEHNETNEPEDVKNDISTTGQPKSPIVETVEIIPPDEPIKVSKVSKIEQYEQDDISIDEERIVFKQPPREKIMFKSEEQKRIIVNKINELKKHNRRGMTFKTLTDLKNA